MTKSRTMRHVLPLLIVGLLGAGWGCEGADGQPGGDGTPGPAGDDGQNGSDGVDGVDGVEGPKGDEGDPAPPLTTASNLAEFVKERVGLYAADELPAGEQFPLAAAATDSVRSILGMHGNQIISWFEPLTFNGAPSAPHFGAGADYIAYFGDGWNDVAGAPPQFNGSGMAGWVWVNHEYMSGYGPTLTSAPTHHQLIFARHLKAIGVLMNDVTSSSWEQADIDTFVRWAKREVGGSWLRIVQDPASGEWEVDRSAAARRYDATSNTLLRVSGQTLSGLDQDDVTGAALPAGVVSGIMSDCAGGLTPWGTVITAEENVQDYYGDLEACWSSDQKFLTGQGFDPGANISPVIEASVTAEYGRISDPNGRHARDFYGYLTEIDPGQPGSEYEGKTTPGTGHKKLGLLGRARWEAAAFAVDGDWKLVAGQPIVAYGGDDRRSGRIYKFVSSGNYMAGMSRAATRALLDEGKLYVAHFAGLDVTTGTTMVATGAAPTEAAPGAGQWIELSVDSTAIAPNAAALGDPTKTVGAALRDVEWNGIGGFPTNDDVRRALFTASAKLGVMELNRPEDMEYNPRDLSGTPRVYVTLTNHKGRTQLDQEGVLRDPATQSTSASRVDKVGAIYAIEEANAASPGTSMTFSFFDVWHGSEGQGDFDAACPDNLLIDHDGGVWFGTDSNFAVNSRSDALYYLDLDPAHRAGEAGITTPTFGLAFRVISVPSDAEATGPTFSSDMGTIFLSVQHPGEEAYSSWPNGVPLSTMIAFTFAP